MENKFEWSVYLLESSLVVVTYLSKRILVVAEICIMQKSFCSDSIHYSDSGFYVLLSFLFPPHCSTKKMKEAFPPHCSTRKMKEAFPPHLFCPSNVILCLQLDHYLMLAVRMLFYVCGEKVSSCLQLERHITLAVRTVFHVCG